MFSKTFFFPEDESNLKNRPRFQLMAVKKKIDALNSNGYVALALIALRKSFNFQASVFQNFYIAEVGFILQRMK